MRCERGGERVLVSFHGRSEFKWESQKKVFGSLLLSRLETGFNSLKSVPEQVSKTRSERRAC